MNARVYGNPEFRIGERHVGPGHACYVIAEAGSNHNRDLATALRLIEVAAEAGADAVKFQTYTAEGMYSDLDPAWRKVKQAEIPWEWHPQLARHATQLGITVFSSPFEERAVDVLEAAGTPAYKIASYEINHLPLIRYAAHTGKPLLISTGMASLGDIERALDAAADAGGRDLLLMHCVATYPPSFDELNLRAIGTLRDAFQLPIGWSDHTLGHTADVVAVSLGACAVEKHFTLSRQQDGPDHPFALEPHELQAMVVAIRQAEAALGSTVKRMTDDATDEYRRGRRSLMAARDVAAGRVIVRDDVAVKRPGSGIAVYHLDQVVGSRAARDLARDQSLRWDDLIH